MISAGNLQRICNRAMDLDSSLVAVNYMNENGIITKTQEGENPLVTKMMNTPKIRKKPAIVRSCARVPRLEQRYIHLVFV